MTASTSAAPMPAAAPARVVTEWAVEWPGDDPDRYEPQPTREAAERVVAMYPGVGRPSRVSAGHLQRMAAGIVTAPTRAAVLAADATNRVFTATAHAATIVVSRGLPVTRVECSAGAVQHLRSTDGLGDGGHRFVGEPAITVSTTPAGVLGWCDALGITQVRLHRQRGQINAYARIIRDGHRWCVAATIPRTGDSRLCPDLPGAQPADRIPWARDHATIGCARLAVALTARGLA